MHTAVCQRKRSGVAMPHLHASVVVYRPTPRIWAQAIPWFSSSSDIKHDVGHSLRVSYGANGVVSWPSLSRVLLGLRACRCLGGSSGEAGDLRFTTKKLTPELDQGACRGKVPRTPTLAQLANRDLDCPETRRGPLGTGERLPAFSVQLDPPPTSDGTLAADLARASAERYGREALDVELDRQAALARIDGGRHRERESTESDGSAGLSWPTLVAPGTGLSAPDGTVIGAEIPEAPDSRSPRKRRTRPRKGPAAAARTQPTPSGDADGLPSSDALSIESLEEE